MTSRPPRLAAWLLQRVGGERGAYMVGELDEEYHRYVRPTRTALSAGAWYWRQVLTSLPAAILPPASAPSVSRFSVRLPDLNAAARDLRHALRSILRSPRFSLTVVLTLGLGIGAGTSVYALVDQLLFRPPPHVQEPERVRRMYLLEHRPPSPPFTSTSLAWVDYEMVSQATTALESVAAYWTTRRSLGRGDGARRIAIGLATPSFFATLGVAPAVGRLFSDAENVMGVAPMPCVAGHAFWRGELGEDISALGRELLVGGSTCVVVGVLPDGFNGVGLGGIDLWLPIRPGTPDSFGADPLLWTTDRSHWVRIVARLAPDVTAAVAGEVATAAYRGFTDRRRDPELTAVVEWGSIMPGRMSVRESVVSTSTLLLAGGGVLLALIVMNLVNLFVVRELGRASETALRLALGSSRWRLFLSRTAEAALLALASGGVAYGVAAWLGPIVRAMIVTRVDFAGAAVTWRVGLLGFLVALAIGVFIAAVATVRAGRFTPAGLLQAAGSSRAVSSPAAASLRLGLVGVQAALSVALLVTSFAFVASFRRASGVDLGFDRRNLLAASVDLRDLGFELPERQAFYGALWERAQRYPGVTSASLGYMSPWLNNRNERVAIPGRDSLPNAPRFGAPAFDAVTPDYLETMGMTLRRGRWFTERDSKGSAPVLVVNEALAQLYWRDDDALGHCLIIGTEAGTPCRTVVGVVADHQFTGRLAAEPIAAYFMPLAQADEYGITPRLFVRTADGAGAVVSELRRFVQSTAPNLPAANIVSIESLFAPLVAPWRLGAYAFTGLGILATAVGMLGLFSVLSYVVAERRREFAIRIAVGASARQITIPVIRRGVSTVLGGVTVGFAIVLGAARWLQPLLFETRMTDPAVLGTAAVVSLVVATLATIAPARGAATRDPMATLRMD